MKSRVVKVGHTSVVVYVRAISEIEKTQHVDGYLTFVCVEPDTQKKRLVNIQMDETTDPEELAQRERAENLSGRH